MEEKARELLVVLRRLVKMNGLNAQKFVLANNLGQNFFPQAIKTGKIQLAAFLRIAESLEVPPHVLWALVDQRAFEALDWQAQIAVKSLQEDLEQIHIRGVDDANTQRN